MIDTNQCPTGCVPVHGHPVAVDNAAVLLGASLATMPDALTANRADRRQARRDHGLRLAHRANKIAYAMVRDQRPTIPAHLT
jgi:hypothetical protein